MTTTAGPYARRHQRPFLGFRREPGRLALAVFRTPLPLYRHGFGWVLGHTFLVLTHRGRTTGQPHDIAAMVLAHDPSTGEYVVCSVWGAHTDWVRNLHAGPGLLVRTGGESFVPAHRFLDDEEAFTVVRWFRRAHPWRLRLISRVLGVGDLTSDETVRELIRTRPFIALRPAAGTTAQDDRTRPSGT